MKRHLLLLLILTACVYVAPAAEPTLESLTQIYKKQVQAIEDQHMEALGRISAQYGADLNRAIEILKKEGDPDQALAGIAEKKRFEVELQGPSSVGEKLPTIIQKCQEKYRNAARTASVAKGKQFVALTDRYVRALDSLMRKLTADGKFQQAVKVKEEKAKVGFALADVETKLKAIDVGTNKATMMPVSLRRGLVLHYGFDVDEGERVTDKSGQGNHGNLKGAERVATGKYGAGCSLRGTAHIRVPDSDSIDLPETFTVILWRKFAASCDGSWLVSKSSFASNRRSYHVSHSCQKGVWDLATSQKGAYSSKHVANYRWNASVRTGEWKHVAVVYAANASKGERFKLYINTESIPSPSIKADGAGTPAKNDNPLLIGVPIQKSEGTFSNGLIDEVMIWNRALSEAEIKQVYRLTGGK